jgi:predicted dehydrogenase
VDRRFSPWLNRALAWCRERGPVRYVQGSMVRPRRRERDFITGTGIHAVDAMRHLAGEVERFEGVVRDQPDLGSRWFHVDFRFRGGARGRLDILPTAGMCEERYELFGHEFRACAAIPIGGAASLRCWQDGRTALAEQTPPGTPQHVTCGAYAETSHFVRGLREGGLGPTLSDVLPSVEICYALDRQAAEPPA